MGNEESTPLLADDSKDVITSAASELATQMTKEALRNAKTVATEVAGVVAGAIARAIVTGLWGVIFPAESSVDLTIKEIRSVVKQELEQDTIVHIKGKLHDLMDFLSKDYKTDKENLDLTNVNDRRRLHDKLERANDHFIGTVGILMQEQYAKIGLPSFLLLAGLRLALYQEMANVDPANHDPNLSPAQSMRYAKPKEGLVALYAKKYADHVDSWWPRIVEDRRKMVKFYRRASDPMEPRPPMDGNDDPWWRALKEAQRPPSMEWFDDDATGEHHIDAKSYDISPLPELSQSSVYERYEAYKNKVASKLAAKFNQPADIVANWRKLIDQPINTKIN